jgi:hypothetical protein
MEWAPLPKRVALPTIFLLTVVANALAVADGCAFVIGTADGYVSVRSGPGVMHPEVMRLRSREFIAIDDKPGDPSHEWLHVTGLMHVTSNGELRSEKRVEGWVFGSHLVPISCSNVVKVPNETTYANPLCATHPSLCGLDTRDREAAPSVRLDKDLAHGIVRRAPGGMAIAPFSVRTSAGASYFIKLVRPIDNREQIALFVVGGRHFSTKVPTGTYELRYAVGQDWIDEQEYFGPKTAFYKADRLLMFSVEGDRVVGTEVELVLQRGGNLRTSTIGKDKF